MKKDVVTTLTKKQHQEDIDWYFHIVTYLLNRADGLPVAIKDLIRERNMENSARFGPPPKDKGK